MIIPKNLFRQCVAQRGGVTNLSHKLVFDDKVFADFRIGANIAIQRLKLS